MISISRIDSPSRLIPNPHILDSVALLIKLNLLTRNQTLLQSSSDPDRSDGALQLHRQLRVIETGSSELIRLSDESLPEASVVVRRDLAPDTSRLVDVDQVGDGLGVDGQLTLCTDDLGACVRSC